MVWLGLLLGLLLGSTLMIAAGVLFFFARCLPALGLRSSRLEGKEALVIDRKRQTCGREGSRVGRNGKS